MKELSYQKNITIVRGINSFVQRKFIEQTMGEETIICSLYDYFYKNGHYQFKPDSIKEALDFCKNEFLKAIKEEVSNIAVVNPNIDPKDFAFYEKYGLKYGYNIFWVVVENRSNLSDNQNIPIKQKQKQHKKISESLKL